MAGISHVAVEMSYDPSCEVRPPYLRRNLLTSPSLGAPPIALHAKSCEAFFLSLHGPLLFLACEKLKPFAFLHLKSWHTDTRTDSKTPSKASQS